MQANNRHQFINFQQNALSLQAYVVPGAMVVLFNAVSMRFSFVSRLVLIFCLVSCAFAGQAATNTSAKQYPVATDSAGVVQLAKDAWKVVETNPDESFKLYQELLRQGIKRNWPTWQAWLT